MLASHTCLNLDGFPNNETNTIFNHTFHLPFGDRRVAVDNTLIPTGEIVASTKGSVNDGNSWSAPKQIGHDWSVPEIHGNCRLLGWRQAASSSRRPLSENLVATRDDSFILLCGTVPCLPFAVGGAGKPNFSGHLSLWNGL